MVIGLRGRGIDVRTAVDEDLGGAPDAELLEHGRRTGRVLLTNDDHFLSMASDADHAGVLFLTTQFAGASEIVAAVVTLVDTLPDDAFEGRVHYVP